MFYITMHKTKKPGLGRAGAKAVVVLLAAITASSLTGCTLKASGQGDDNIGPFYPDRVVTVRFVMTEEDWAYLRENAREESYVRADMWYDGELVPDIAVRPKGNSSLSSTIERGSNKFGLKADLNFFNAERNLDGVKKLNFNNGFSDPTFMREILSYELFAQMGLPTPRASFVDVYVNDIHLGLYTMVEQIDQTFLARYFTDISGNLYKPEMPAAYLNWTAEDLGDTLKTTDISDVNLGGGNLNEILEALGQEADDGEDPEANVMPPNPGGFNFPKQPSDNVTRRNVVPGAGMAPLPGTSKWGDYLEQMGLKTNENKPEYDALLRFLDILNNEPDATFAEEIEKVLDVDQMLRFLAVSAVLVHLDNYIGMGHNYYLYEVGGKFTIIPWDLNMSFGNFNSGLDRDGIINFLIDEPTAGPVAARPLVARLLAVPEYMETYHEYISEMISGPFSSEVMNARIDEIADLIRRYVAADTRKFFTLQAFESFTGEGGITTGSARAGGIGLNIGLKTFVAERIASIEKQLAGDLPSTNNGQGNGGSFLPGGANVFNRNKPGQ